MVNFEDKENYQNMEIFQDREIFRDRIIFQDVDGLVLKRVEIHVENQDTENFQDMEKFQDTKLSWIWIISWMWKLNIIHYIVQPSLKENKYVIGYIKYIPTHFINKC